jgi:hypothetical protein
MPDVALISDLTWRSVEMQRKAFPDMPHFLIPDDLTALFRPTTRKAILRIHVVSYAVIADNRDGIEKFISLCKSKKAEVFSKESMTTWGHNQSNASFIDAWINARRNGAAKRGGEAKAKKDERLFWEGFNKIAHRWHLPAQKENASPKLLSIADISRNTVKAYLGYTREEWQKLSQAKRERILERNSWKGNRDDTA